MIIVNPLHWYYRQQHVEHVRCEMMRRGAPVIRAVWDQKEKCWHARNGTHRLRAALASRLCYALQRGNVDPCTATSVALHDAHATRRAQRAVTRPATPRGASLDRLRVPAARVAAQRYGLKFSHVDVRLAGYTARKTGEGT